MPLSHIEHLLVVANDIELTRAWYEDVLGLETGPHPDFGVPVYWMYLNGQDVVHISQAKSAQPLGEATLAEITAGGRPIHHVAFRATDLTATLAHLEARGVTCVEQQAGPDSLYQVFVRDPNGVIIELNFDAAEAEGRDVPHLALSLEPQRGGARG